MLAVTETYAHLELLLRAGRLVRRTDPSGALVYAVTR
jgi:hypothetical protein